MTAPEDPSPPVPPVAVPAPAAPVPVPMAVSPLHRWKVGLVLAAIFGCGMLVGGLGAMRFLQNGVRRHMDPTQWTAMVLHQLDSRLHLTPAQRERIAPLVRAGAEEARGARRRAFGEARGIIERTHTQIAAELDDKQRAEMERFIAERGRRARRWFGSMPGDGPPPPPPGPRP